MAPRATWKGFLKLSLVSVPVRAFTAHESGSDIRLNQLHAPCHNRIRYQKVCPEHGEVPADEIVSGYEYAKGQYVVIDPQELAKLRSVEADRSIHIDGFIASDALDALYHAGRTYYLLPDGAVGGKPYALLHDAMADRGVSAIAQVVLSGREQLVCVRVLGKLLVMTVLHHHDRIKQPARFEDELGAQALTDEELDLTRTLIDASLIRDFDLANYPDEYRRKLTALIQAKVEGEELVQVPDAEQPKILNLMEALKRSVEQAGEGTAQPEPKKKKMAPSSGARRKKRQSKTG